MYRPKRLKLHKHKVYGVELIDVKGLKATKSITAYGDVVPR